MTEYRPNKINKLTPGGAQREIIKHVIRSGGACYEPEIREYLRYKFHITAITGVKNHLEKLEFGGILKKESAPGIANIWAINEAEDASFDYLSDLILESGWDTNQADDISAIFGSDIIYQLAKLKSHQYRIFLSEYLPWVFKKFIEEEVFTYALKRMDIPNALLDVYNEAIRVSPSLFVTGSLSKGHKSLLTVISLLLPEGKNTGNADDFGKWLLYNTIYAGFILDITIYPKLRGKILNCAAIISKFFLEFKGDDEILSYRIENYLKLQSPDLSFLP
ncbi:MAG TPA: hypothetical protein VN372_02905 [Methanospirillum sp.]|nr:hypothetical protein [Methanospirillum sp.]